MKKLIFVTGNKAKAEDVQKIMDIPIEIKDIDLDEIQELDLEKIAIHKAMQAFNKIKSPVFVDDVGFYVEAWNNFPGPLVKWILKSGGEQGASLLLKMLEGVKDRSVTARSAIAYHDGEKIHYFVGEARGTAAVKIRAGNNFGFGWDCVFIPDGFNKTYGEMTFEEKNEISHRRKAFDKFKQFLNSQKTKKEI